LQFDRLWKLPRPPDAHAQLGSRHFLIWPGHWGALPESIPDHDEENFERSFQDQDSAETALEPAAIEPAKYAFCLGRNRFYHSVIDIGHEY
jgi:hypothetical protein